MERRPLIAGNWKMNLNIQEAQQLANDVLQSAAKTNDRDIMIAPPFTALTEIAHITEKSSVILAAQNCCWAEEGAFTGEISPIMLKDLGCSMVILGHSERRHVFGEDDTIINKRLIGAMRLGLKAILCIGETLEERESGKTLAVLEDQVRKGLKDVSVDDPTGLILAYEPVWAIGTGKTASKEQAQEVHAFIRKILVELYEKTIASKLRILYGGSVNPDNVDSLMAQVDIDGALVGGAALKSDMFDRIINFK